MVDALFVVLIVAVTVFVVGTVFVVVTVFVTVTVFVFVVVVVANLFNYNLEDNIKNVFHVVVLIVEAILLFYI
jgi:hypothetical protein